MIAYLRSLFHRPAIRFGMSADRRGRFRDPRFASFIQSNNRRMLNTDIADALLQGRKLFRNGLIVALLVGGTWVLVESAKALSMF